MYLTDVSVHTLIFGKYGMQIGNQHKNPLDVYFWLKKEGRKSQGVMAKNTQNDALQ